ncbi:matrix-remodeling-associated protein 7-like isoform X1 [Seriola aureovittata]|uniref:matrix-remodeling-associated protein 7-like isoform X1 n=1 Tax=Seriola aureovittata TaxID=2871759 RepID=UPI0024BE6613|nr:matrix-remodeling-associated protein 7-like isoform X1 [Seriola aureovittata]
MSLTFVLSAIIFTLLAIVVATSLFNGSSTADFANARSYFGAAGGLDQSGPKQNGYLPEKKKKKKAADDWCEISGSSHDHWDVVKSVLSEEAHPQPLTEELATPVEHSSSTSSLSIPRPGSRHMSLEVDSSSEVSSGRGRRSFIGLSDKELIKCAFSYPQTEGATESPGINDKVESNANNSLKYVPGKARSHHLQMMMSKDELEEEQRVQREQLAAIFQLLHDNKETFGEVSEGDMEEQLRLYSI